MSVRPVLCCFGLCLLLAACAGKKYDPWRIAPETFASSVRTVAMFPVQTPRDLADPDPPRLLFDSLVTDALLAAGFVVVPSDSAGTMWDQLLSASGGFFDPVTGQRDGVKYDSLRTLWARDVRSRLQADAVVFPAIVEVAAEFSEARAKWDGTSQKIEGFGGSFLRALAGTSRRGTTPALSLRVDVEADGKLLYRNQGGIEVSVKPAGGLGSGWNPVPRVELFRDPERNAKAVRIALEPIVGKPGSAR